MNTDDFEAANARGAALLASTLKALSARYEQESARIVVELSTGVAVAFAPRLARGLEHATPADLERIEISPSGLGLHVPALDADVYLPTLLASLLTLTSIWDLAGALSESDPT